MNIGFVLDDGTAIHATISTIVPAVGQQVWFSPEIIAKAKLHPGTKLWVKSHQYQYAENESGIEVTLPSLQLCYDSIVLFCKMGTPHLVLIPGRTPGIFYCYFY